MTKATFPPIVKNIASWTFAASALFYFAVLPWLYSSALTIAFYVFYISFVLDFVINERYKSMKFTAAGIIYICFIVYYLMIAASPLFENDSRYAMTLIERRLSFLGLGVIGLLGGLNDKLKLKYFAYVGLFMSLVCIVYIINKMGWSTFFTDPNAIRIFNSLRHHNINAHMGFNFYLLLSVTLTYCCAKDYFNPDNSKADRAMIWIGSIVSVILLWFVINSHGRVGMLFALLLILFIVIDLLKRKPLVLGTVICIILALAIIFVLNEPRLSEYHLFERNPRLPIWQLSLNKISESPIFGYGCSTAFSMLSEEFITDYWSVRINDALINHMLADGAWIAAHCHNQLLQSWMELGIPGLLIILAIMILPFFCLKRNKFFFAFCLIFVFLDVQLLTDIVDGAYSTTHFCFYYLMLLSLQGKNRPLLTKCKN